jgi:hypothetical protein
LIDLQGSHFFNLEKPVSAFKTKNVAYKYRWGAHYKELIDESPLISWLQVFPYSPQETGFLIFSGDKPPAVD